jgi:hypothetical protein
MDDWRCDDDADAFATSLTAKKSVASDLPLQNSNSFSNDPY